jgi:hypothetical protein
LIVTIFNYFNYPKFLNLRARNSSLLAIANLVYLCFIAALSYISSRSFYLPFTFSNYRISLRHSLLTPFPLLSFRGFEFSTSPLALAAILSFAKALEVCYLSNASTSLLLLYNSVSFTLSSFTYLPLTLDSSGVLLIFAINYDPLLFEALYTLILYTAIDFAHGYRLCTRLLTLHTTLDFAYDFRLCIRLCTRLSILYTPVDL